MVCSKIWTVYVVTTLLKKNKSSPILFNSVPSTLDGAAGLSWVHWCIVDVDSLHNIAFSLLFKR